MAHSLKKALKTNLLNLNIWLKKRGIKIYQFVLFLLGVILLIGLIVYSSLSENKNANLQLDNEDNSNIETSSIINLNEADVIRITAQQNQVKNDDEIVITKSPKVEANKIFCIINTDANRLNTFVKFSYRIWVRKCDDYVYVTAFDERLLTADLLLASQNSSIEITVTDDRIKLMQPRTWIREDKKKMTIKNYISLIEIHKKYPNYAWYLRANDDAFIFMENLHSFLKDKNHSEALAFGHKMIPSLKGYQDFWLSTGAGYVLSNEAIKRFEKLVKKKSLCPMRQYQDQDIAICIQVINITLGEQVDAYGRDRFHPFDVVGHYIGRFPHWTHFNLEAQFKKNDECCSEDTISFNNFKLDEMIKMGVLYDDYLKKKSNNEKPSFYSVIKNMEIYIRYGHGQQHQMYNLNEYD